jgi:multidrug efflux pump subunit AcrA (membrane-fusion protein)
VLAGCSKDKAEEAAVAVKAAPVEKTTIQHVVMADAVLFPLQQASLVPKISSPVKTFYVNKGSRVHKGQLLAMLENQDLAGAAEDNKGAFEQAEAAYTTGTASSVPEEMQKATSDAESAKQLYDAEQKLYDSRQELFKEGALPRKDLDQATVSLTQARAQYELAKKHLDALNAVVKQQELKGLQGQLSSARGKYMGAKAQLSYSEIRSPIDGFVTERPLYPGEMAAQGTPLMTVMDLSKVTARAHIPQSGASLLKVGDKATITVSGAESPIEGKVSLIGPALDPNSTTVEVWVEAKNPQQRLKPGSSVRVTMVAKTVPEALVVPASAVLTAADGSTTVMVVGSDQKAHQQAVKIGIKQGDDVQIVEGLKEGQTIVTEGAYGLPDNTKVSIEAAKEEEKPGAAEESKDSGKDEKK